jgi:6-phospho-beta-glucosidase
MVLVEWRGGGNLGRRVPVEGWNVAAPAVDETLPLACGCVGQQTTGFGGLAKALRTVPVALEIAEQVRSTSPGAWIVDFTNPVGIVTRALLDEGHRAVGLCSAAMVFQRRFARVLGAAPQRVELDHAGLNHLTFKVEVRVDAIYADPSVTTKPGLLSRRRGTFTTSTWTRAGRSSLMPWYPGGR